MSIASLPLVAAIAAIVSAGLTPLLARYAVRAGIISRPRPDRWHPTGAIPLLGGVAIAAGALAAIVPYDGSSRPLLAVGLAVTAALALGIVDDVRHIAPTTKLVGQVLVGSILVIGGVRVEIVDFAPVSYLLTIFWVVGMMNALNLMDNMDGLAAGIAAIAGLGLALTDAPDNLPAALVAAATAGAALGFLTHNFPPARVFMGDAGSQVLGLLLAAAALLHTFTGAANVGLTLLGPLAVLALPIFDTALVVASRRIAGLSFAQGGRDHTSHRLAALGLSERAVVLSLYGVGAGLAAIGVWADAVGASVLPVVGVAAVALVLFGVFLHEVEVYEHRGAVPASEESPVRRGISIYGRFGAEVLLDATLLTIVYFSAFQIRFEGVADSAWFYLFVASLPIVIGAQLGTLVVMRVYRTLWRYLGLSDALAIVRATIIGTAVAALGVVLVFRFAGYSRAVFVLDGLAAGAALISARAFVLWLRQGFAERPTAQAVRVLIVGATERGAVAMRLLTRAEEPRYRIVGFVDDDPGKRHRNVSGVPVVGRVADLAACVERTRAAVVVVALDAGTGDAAAEVRATCAQLGVECRELALTV